MLAEGAHSVADTVNELFLMTSLRRSRRPPDPTHPFGYGKERFFWSLLAAVGIFVTGALFSLFQGVTELASPGEQEKLGAYIASYAVLFVSFVLEGISWLKAVHQLRTEAQARNRALLEHVRRSTDPTVKTVFSEDSAALVGIVFAAIGVVLHQLTGSQVWDAAAAIAIGLLLGYVAYMLGRDTKDLLIGEAADPELRDQLYEELLAYDEINEVIEVLTMYLGPDQLLLAARIDFAPDLDSDRIEATSSRIAKEIRERHPEVTQIFLDATHATEQERDRAHRVSHVDGRPR
jgi:cation diffusion facilitator family transporter